MTPEKSIFSKIIDREIPSEIVYEDEKCIVINDINPKARIHLLVIPKKPIATLFDLAPEDKDLMGHMMLLLPQLAQSQGLDGFKTQIHTGESGGQEVFHIHIHLLGN
ncbi:MAG: histidine triad nucleotide-binding protein [Hydrogenovibrio crunogenus]|uniref:Purine nucleoside phosphoramidase n=2 Tax=Hydrogenovibrio crunogenus TaxID=39765 RepID=A0A4P7P1J1_9GAMM|nr:histidine triad nucleotide-binding protein [Hydrogenovibrio crunogenus]MBD3610961.1 histidine triad nucleotide-binding protein [Hydrogenovibrio crunogenus]QBZ84013.1 Purine nucleoside phosphoramidase [Hydrogenovibrio crunogenus]RUM92985.1 MAG: histidine triad nucleotide-binding protein [Thiomicrospira sp.]